MTQSVKIPADIVLLTVNKHEQNELLSSLEDRSDRKLEPLQGESNEIYLDAGEMNGQRVLVAKSLIGSTASGASFDTATNILADLSPQLIIAVGIAWGAKDKEGQQIGDILISTHLRDSQHHKITPDGVIPRGTIQAANGTVVKTFLQSATSLGKRASEGLMISIETLFDDEKERDKFLHADHDQPIGGEMEGSGLLMALRKVTDRRVDWLVVKAICDWGFKKNENLALKEGYQRTAAKNAAELVVATINSFRLVRPRALFLSPSSHFISEPVPPSALGRDHTPAAPRERSIAKTVQAYIGNNSSFVLDNGYPIKYKDWAEKIIFELYSLSEEIGSTKCFLYVHENSNQHETLMHLRKNGLLKKEVPLIVLTEKPLGLRESQRRKENLGAIFDTRNVFFIDEFGLRFLYKEHIQGYVPYKLPVYIESLTDNSFSSGSESALRQLKAWYSSHSAPLMVVKGYGGIGKTTLVKQFLDEIHAENGDTGILFIDSQEIIGELETIIQSRSMIDDIYDFYDAQLANQVGKVKRLSKDLLSLSVDNGSLVIVLDGIDEVIAKLGAKFDAVSFINSISTIYSTNLQRAKIIITCRDYFWDSLHDVGSVMKIDLKPFTLSMAEEFFRKSLHAEIKVAKALAIAKRFALKPKLDVTEVYIPYVLDLIVYLIKQKDEFGDAPVASMESTSLLNSTIPNDFLVASVCQREISKLHTLGVESQIEFLMQLSVAKDGHISIYDLKSLISRLPCEGKQAAEETIERLKGHPLLICSGNKVYFRYDFFNEYFKSLYIAKYFLAQDLKSLCNNFIEVSANHLRFDGEFMKTVGERLVLDDDLLLFGVETVARLREDLRSLDRPAAYKNLRACSAVFCLFLSLKRDGVASKFDVEHCTNLMNTFFGEKEKIHGLALINVASNSAAKPIFDFRGRVLRECYFERYDFFWECPIDEGTRFYDSTLKSLEPRSGVRPSFYITAFDTSCDTAGISHLLARIKNTASHRMSAVKEDLVVFFRLFYQRGNFYPQRQDVVRSKTHVGKYLPTLTKNGVIQEFTDREKLRRYRVTSKYMPIVKHIEQGGPCIEFERVVKMFSS
jgi:nucleoside phosphorylase